MHAVIFDIDGTLLQSADVDDALYRESVRSILGPVQFRSSLSDYDFVTDSGILAQVLEDNSLSWSSNLVANIQNQFLTAMRTHISGNGPFVEIPGARQHFCKLRDSDQHSIAVATGGWRATASLKLASAGFDLRGTPLATSDDALERMEIMRIALSEIGSEFESITYYGDGPWDRDACHDLGWRFVAVGAHLGGIESYLDASVV